MIGQKKAIVRCGAATENTRFLPTTKRADKSGGQGEKRKRLHKREKKCKPRVNLSKLEKYPKN